MIYLAISIVCNTLLALCFALCGKKGKDSMNATLFNYITASGSSLFLTINTIKATGVSHTGEYTLPLGVITGAFYLICIIAYQFAITKSGPSSATMFKQLSMILPILIAILFLGETAGLLRWSGIILAIAALFIYNYDGSALHMDLLLISVFFTSGAVSLLNKLFAYACPAEDEPFFLTIVFGVAALLTLTYNTVKKNHIPDLTEIALGIAIGLNNVIGTSCQVKALVLLPGTVVFPVLAVGIIILTTISGRLFFGEKLSKKVLLSLAISAVSIVILNIE